MPHPATPQHSINALYTFLLRENEAWVWSKTNFLAVWSWKSDLNLRLSFFIWKTHALYDDRVNLMGMLNKGETSVTYSACPSLWGGESIKAIASSSILT